MFGPISAITVSPALLHPRDRRQPLHRLGKRGHHLLDPAPQPTDQSFQMRHVIQQQPQLEAVVLGDAPVQGGLQGGDLVPQPLARLVGQLLRVLLRRR